MSTKKNERRMVSWDEAMEFADAVANASGWPTGKTEAKDRVFKVRTTTSNVTDDNTLTVRGAELPSTIVVWDSTDPQNGHKLMAAVTVDVGTVQIWGPNGEELGTWLHTDCVIEPS